MADSRIKSVSDLLLNFFDAETSAKGKSSGNFRTAWRGIAGDRLAEHSRPVDIHHGILIVETEHQGWTQLLQFQQERILEEIQHKFPELEIRGIAWRLTCESLPEPPLNRTSKRAFRLSQDDQSSSAQILPISSIPTDRIEAGREVGHGAAVALPPELKAVFERMKLKNKG